MTMLSSAAGRPAPQSLASGFVRVLGSWANGFVSYWVRRQAVKNLHDLDDRALRDIGIVRSHIEDAVRGAVDPSFGRMM